MSAPAAPPTAVQHKRHDCVGMSYYSAWMRMQQGAPVCLGFSQVRAEEDVPTGTALAAADPHAQPASNPDFKQVCIGYSSYSTAKASSDLLPHCEGIEFVLEGVAEAAQQQQQPQAASSLQAAPQPPHSISQLSHNSGGTGNATVQGPQQVAVTQEPQQQHQRQQQQQQGTEMIQEEDAKQLQPTHVRLMVKAAANWAALQRAANNDGAIKFKPWPKDAYEVQDRLWEEAYSNGSRVVNGLGRLASTAYQLTVKPITDNLGITPRTKS